MSTTTVKVKDPASKAQVPWQALVEAKNSETHKAIPKDWLIPASLLEGVKLGPSATTNVIALDIPRKSGILSEAELALTEDYSAGDLLSVLAKGTITALELTIAFSKRAAIAQQLTSCLTEMFFDRAQERARFLDEHFKKEGKPFGPLHGLPISIKDSFNYTGIPSTIGYVSFIDHPLPEKNSPLVDLLLDLGAVLYVKTNIPQTLMTADSDNNIFGRTLNPHNLSLAAGGSSGGEGALVAFRGSPLGVGTDIAGSIRIPSFCCGTYGFKPSSGRIPFAGQAEPALEGIPGILPCAGPLANTIDDLELFTKAVLGAKPWDYDATAHAVPFQSLPPRTPNTPLRIGILEETPSYPLHPPVRRAFTSAVHALAAAGHTLIPLPPTPATDLHAALALAWRMLSIDTTHTGIRFILDSAEPMMPSVKNVITFYAPWTYQPTEGVSDIVSYAHLAAAREEMMQAWNQRWRAESLDVIVAPPAQNTAAPHDTFVCVPYTILWNLLDYPAVIIPYSSSSKDLDPTPVHFEAPAAGVDYNPEATHGAPCAIQVVARRFEDERCLHAAKIIDQALKASPKAQSQPQPQPQPQL